MIRPSKRYIFYIQDSSGKSYYQDGYDNNGVAKIKTIGDTIHFLDFNPQNWQDSTIGYGRSEKYFGLNRSFTTSYTFVRDGAEILRYLFYKKGFENKSFLIICQHNSDTDNYEPYYKGEIDLTQIKDDVNTVTVNMIEGGLLKVINANDKTKYDFNYLTNEKVLYDGIQLYDTLNFEGYQAAIYAPGNYTVPLTYINNEGDSVGLKFASQTMEDAGNAVPGLTNYLNTSSNYALSTDVDTPLRITGIFAYKVTSVGDAPTFNNQLAILTDNAISDADVDGLRYFLADDMPVDEVGKEYEIPFEVSFTMLAGEKIFFVTTITAPGFGDWAIEVNQDKTKFKIESETINEETTSNFYRPLDLLNQIVSKMSDGKYTAQSTLLTQWRNLVTVSGQSLRNLEKSVLPTSLEDFYTSYNAVLKCAMYVVNNVLHFETRETVLPQTINLFSGEVRDFNVVLATDYIYNTVKIGYPVQDYNERNGRYEFNTTFNFSFPILNITKELNLVSVYRGDSYGIEFIRENYKGQITTDAKSDNEVFFTMISDNKDEDGNFLLSRPNYSAIQGIPANMPLTGKGAIFNTEISPKRNLYRWGNWIRSFCYLLGAEKTKYLTSDKNKDLVTTLGDITIVEKADVRIDTFDPAIFYPFIFTYKTRVPDTFLGVMNVSANGHINSEVNGVDVYGFPINLSVKPVFNEVQEWKILASTLNNIDALLNLEPFNINSYDMSTYRLSFPLLSPISWVPVGNVILPQYNTVHMDEGFWHEQIDNYIQRESYYQPWQKNDTIKLQCFTNGLGPVQVDVFTCKHKLVGTYPLQEKETNAIKSPFVLFEGNISLETFEEGTYYLLATAGISTKVQFISEVINVRRKHIGTKLFNYKHSKNKLHTVFTTGYNPDFRIEAEIKDFVPGANFSSYEDEPANIELIEGIPFRKFTLEVGKRTFGMPSKAIDKLNRIMLLDYVLIDGKQFTREEDAQFEPERVIGVPGAFWTMPIREGKNRQEVTVGSDGNLEKRVAVIYNVDTALFGDFTNQVSSNIVQAERLENTQ